MRLCERLSRKRLLKVHENDGADFGGGYRASEEKSLHLIGVGSIEKCGLFRSLDTFDGYPHIQLASQRDDRLHYRFSVSAFEIGRASCRERGEISGCRV